VFPTLPSPKLVAKPVSLSLVATTGPNRKAATTQTQTSSGRRQYPPITEAAVTFIICGQLADSSVIPDRLAPLTNFFNNVFDPEKDFPVVAPAGLI
jgi:hypothetical protein